MSPEPMPAPQRPLARPPSPDQLDRMLVVVPSRAWTALALLGAGLAAGLVWSIFWSAPVKVSGEGILLSPGGVADIVSPAQGTLARLLVAAGERVSAGQPVAVLEQPDLGAQIASRRLEREKLEDQKLRVAAFLSSEQAARDVLVRDRDASLKSRVRSLGELETTTRELLAAQEGLLEKGLLTRDRMLATRSQLQQIQADLAEAETTLTQIATDEQLQATRAHREILDIDMKIAAVDRDIEALTADLGRKSSVVAAMDGMVVEQAANPGELIAAGAPVLRILPREADGGATLVDLVYVTRGEGKKMRPGMAAQVIPSTVRVQRDGFIRGRVVSVSAIPASRESMLRVLKNSTLVDQLTRDGAPVAVSIALERDPTTPSGFAWSSGQGPATPIPNGTMSTTEVVVGDIPILALVVPSIEFLLKRLGL